ncbi:IS3 family transposase [Candidatus Poriferisodalis sp.]|uniref:IS3 family transposase n=1 Tax=Candidatus Poriferisodalis sp. TaxID=3101277 RepID=UPI003AF690B5
MTRYRWIAARKAEGFPTAMCCRAAKVSRQAFYDWRRRCAAGPTDREAAEADLVAEISQIHAASGGAYGSPRVAAELRARGHRVNPKRVARLMRAHQIAGIRPRRPKRTTTPARSAPKLPDLVGRRFAPGRPDRAWVSDIT